MASTLDPTGGRVFVGSRGMRDPARRAATRTTGRSGGDTAEDWYDEVTFRGD